MGSDMYERRSEPRLLCADLVEVKWHDKRGKSRQIVANLEDISVSGACLQLEAAIPLETTVVIRHAGGDLAGTVRYCVYREIGYYLGVAFADGQKWSQRHFRPQHLYDPRRLAAKEARKTGRA